MADAFASYNKAHDQPWDVNAALPVIEDWSLYNAAHADPNAVPIHAIQASPAGHLAASVSTRLPSLKDEEAPVLVSGAEASLDWDDAPATAPVAGIDAHTLGQYEAIAPGLALALVQAEQTRATQSRRYRLARLVVTTIIATAAIACGQWALVHGADQQALYLSGAGLISLLTTVLQHE